jgi:hypothetical protein
VVKGHVLDTTVDTTGQSCASAIVASTVVFASASGGLDAASGVVGASAGPLPIWVDTDAVGVSCATSAATPVRVQVGDLAPGETRTILVSSRGAAGVAVAQAATGPDFYPFFDDFGVVDVDRWRQPEVSRAGAGAAFTFTAGGCGSPMTPL